MRPILFTWNGISVLSYVVIIAAAVLVAILLIRYYEIPSLIARGQCPQNLYKFNGEVLLLVLISSTVGARLGFVFTNWHLYKNNLSEMLAIWKGGLTFHGGMLAALLAVFLHSYFRRIPLVKLLDTTIPYICLAYALGRLGCFLHGCCHGQVTELPWGLIYPAIDSSLRHPTQLYSFAASFIIFLVLLYIHRRSFPESATFSWFLLLHGSYRFVVEFFRVSDYYICFLSLAQVMSLSLILAGFVLLLAQKKRSREGWKHA